MTTRFAKPRNIINSANPADVGAVFAQELPCCRGVEAHNAPAPFRRLFLTSTDPASASLRFVFHNTSSTHPCT
jgi:hypothetical protein